MSEPTIEEILKLEDGHSRLVKVPQWNDAEICVVSMSAVERAEVEKRWGAKEAATDPAAFRSDVLTNSLKKHDKKTPWGTPEQFKALMTKSAAAVEVLFEAACEINGFTAKDVEELGKN